MDISCPNDKCVLGCTCDTRSVTRDRIGSKVAPVGDGNTKPQPSREKSKSKRDASAIHWAATIPWPKSHNRSHEVWFQTWFRENTSRAVYEIEEGSETGYRHMQANFSLKRKQRLEWLKLHLHGSANFSKDRNIEAAFQYCTKNDNAWIYPAPPKRGISDPLLDKTLYDWQTKIIETIKGPADGRKIHWYYDPEGGAGKTTFCRHMLCNYDCAFFESAAKKDIAFAWNGQPICLFNFTREKEGHICYSALEALSDGLVFSSKYESSVKLHDYPHVICFANWPPDQSALSADRWNIVQLQPDHPPLSMRSA